MNPVSFFTLILSILFCCNGHALYAASSTFELNPSSPISSIYPVKPSTKKVKKLKHTKTASWFHSPERSFIKLSLILFTTVGIMLGTLLLSPLLFFVFLPIVLFFWFLGGLFLGGGCIFALAKASKNTSDLNESIAYYLFLNILIRIILAVVLITMIEVAFGWLIFATLIPSAIMVFITLLVLFSTNNARKERNKFLQRKPPLTEQMVE